MEKKLETLPYPLIGGILFALIAVRRLVSFVSSISYLGALGVFYYLLCIAGAAIVAATLFLKRRDLIIAVGFALMALGELINGIRGSDPLYLVAWILAALICVVCLTKYLPQYRENMQTLWLLPACSTLIGLLLYILQTLINLFRGRFHFGSIFMGLVSNILIVVAVLLAMLWVVYPDGLPSGYLDSMKTKLPKKEGTSMNTSESTAISKVATNVPTSGETYYCGLVKHILLLLFTFGIWHMIWIYKVTGYTNEVKGEAPRNATPQLLLCLFVPFYIIFWTYKTAQRIDSMAMSRGLSSDMAILSLILEIFVPIIPPILLQDKLNAIATAGNAKPVQEPVQKQTQAPVQEPAQKPVQNPVREPVQEPVQEPDREETREKPVSAQAIAEELKTFKELMDSGIITQEEFDAKKKQLLGL